MRREEEELKKKLAEQAEAEQPFGKDRVSE